MLVYHQRGPRQPLALHHSATSPHPLTPIPPTTAHLPSTLPHSPQPSTLHPPRRASTARANHHAECLVFRPPRATASSPRPCRQAQAKRRSALVEGTSGVQAVVRFAGCNAAPGRIPSCFLHSESLHLRFMALLWDLCCVSHTLPPLTSVLLPLNFSFHLLSQPLNDLKTCTRLCVGCSIMIHSRHTASFQGYDLFLYHPHFHL